MEFPFNIGNLLSQKITKIEHNLLPEGFSGDRRSAWDYASKISDILDEMGKASAVAQGLQRAITSGERLRNSEHTIYLLTDPEGKSGKGSVVGLLKVGRKKLFVFDAAGMHHELKPLCVLDFYVHESKQRMGCGKALYEYMLKEENTSPQYLAIDRPSEKFLGFLFKHYGLDKILPQSNNFVVLKDSSLKTQNNMLPSSSEQKSFTWHHNPEDNEEKSDDTFLQSRSVSHLSTEFQSTPGAVRSGGTEEQCNGLQQVYGRYAAHRPPSTIGKILQNSGPQQQQQHNGGTTHFAFNIACESPSSLAGDYSIQDVCKSPRSFVTELHSGTNSPPTSCRQHHSTSPIKRDLKFSHSRLW